MCELIPKSKRELRQTMKKKREEMSQREWESKNELIHQQFRSCLEFQRASRVHIYVSIEREVDTKQMIRILLDQGKKVICPKVTGKRALRHFFIRSEKDLESSKNGIMEPRLNCEEASNLHFDLIVIPGLAFDARGHRIGYGGGYYDAFLSNSAGIRMGLGFEFQYCTNVFSEKHDQKLDILLTEKGLKPL